MKINIYTKDERSYFDELSQRSFYAYRPVCGGGKIWQIEELNQENPHLSKKLKMWGSLFKTKDIEGYIKALLDHTERPS